VRFSKVIIPVLFCMGTISSGCWYYSTSGLSLPSYIKTVAVPLAENETVEYGIETLLTDGIVDAFVSDNTLRLADERSADSVVRVNITDVIDEAFTYISETTGEEAREYRIRIIVKASFLDVKKNRKIWEHKSLEGWGTYLAGEQEERDKGMEAAVKMLASEIVQRSVAGW